MDLHFNIDFTFVTLALFPSTVNYLLLRIGSATSCFKPVWRCPLFSRLLGKHGLCLRSIDFLQGFVHAYVLVVGCCQQLGLPHIP